MITVNQTTKDLISLTGQALQSQGMNWQVIQAYQQTMGRFQPPFVLVHRLLTTNYGFQFDEDIEDSHTENQIEIQRFQIEAYYKRTPNDTENTITGADVVRMIARWFMSETGIQALRTKGYNIKRIPEVVEEYYKQVNEIFQVNPHFTMDIVAKQTDTTKAEKISGFADTIKKI